VWVRSRVEGSTFDDARNVAVWSAEDEDATWVFDFHCCFWQVHGHDMEERDMEKSKMERAWNCLIH
jgi:hypothetical protein